MDEKTLNILKASLLCVMNPSSMSETSNFRVKTESALRQLINDEMIERLNK